MQRAPATDFSHDVYRETRQVVVQQIDLLVDDLRPARVLIDSQQLIVAWASLFVVLLFISGYGVLTLQSLKQEAAGLSTQLGSLKQATTAIQSSFDARVDPKLVNDVAELRQRVVGQQQLVAELSDGHRIQRTGFSGYLDDLAQNHVEGLWFTHMRFQARGQQITLNGKTLQALYLPRLLKKLAHNSRFVGHEFDRFEMRADTTGEHRAIDFSITGPAPLAEVELTRGSNP